MKVFTLNELLEKVECKNIVNDIMVNPAGAKVSHKDHLYKLKDVVELVKLGVVEIRIKFNDRVKEVA